MPWYWMLTGDAVVVTAPHVRWHSGIIPGIALTPAWDAAATGLWLVMVMRRRPSVTIRETKGVLPFESMDLREQ